MANENGNGTTSIWNRKLIVGALFSGWALAFGAGSILVVSDRGRIAVHDNDIAKLKSEIAIIPELSGRFHTLEGISAERSERLAKVEGTANNNANRITELQLNLASDIQEIKADLKDLLHRFMDQDKGK